MKSEKQLQEEREESLGYDNSKSHICKHAYPRELCGTCNPIKPLTEPSSDPNSETNMLWRKHVGFSPQSGAAAYELCGKMEQERNVWKHNAGVVAAELEAEREKALDWFIAYQELKGAVAETLEENRHLADGDQCTLKKLKDAYAKAKSAEAGLDSENAEPIHGEKDA